MANPADTDFTVRVLQGEEGRIIDQAGRVLDGAGICRDGHVLEARIGLLVVERDRLAKEWRDVVTALGPHASPACSPAENVADLVARYVRLQRVLNEIDEIAQTQVAEHGDVDGPLTEWERVLAVKAYA